MKHVIIFLFGVMFLQSCRKDKIQPNDIEDNIEYSFFVAGHTYGSPTNYVGGIHQPFKSKFNWMNEDTLLKLGVLTGDIVKHATVQYWDLVDEDLKVLKPEVYFVAGNHDITDRPLYESRYGATYFSFSKNDDLFIVLDGNLDGWRISGEQLSFLKSELSKLWYTRQNIFIFSHQAIYLDEHPIATNSDEGKADSLNFKTEILPIIKGLENEVYLFVGDVGAFDWGIPAFYEKDDNITYIASGMGGGLQDNFVIADVYQSKKVEFRLITLNGNDINAMGKLEDY